MAFFLHTRTEADRVSQRDLKGGNEEIGEKRKKLGDTAEGKEKS